MRVIAYYLPQFHEIKENNEWWGKGFTEWVNVKNAKTYYEGHYQPREPLNDNYYNLLDSNVKKWQVDLAKKNGIYGFCFYHYWFGEGHMLLEKPIEQFLVDKELDINFCLCWANEPWTKAWVSKSDSILIDQNYGNEDYWKKHFEYLLQFFRDDRYIKNQNKPLLVIYKPEQISCLNQMLDYWNMLAKEAGYDGIDFAYQAIGFDLKANKDDSRFAFNIEYEPSYGMYYLENNSKRFIIKMAKLLDLVTDKIFKKKLSELYLNEVRRLKYEDVWNAINNHVPDSPKCVPGAFVDWDNTPRRGSKGLVIDGATPEKFKKFFDKRIKVAREKYKTDMLFIFAWNEWAEGGYLEPDKKYQDGYLKAIREVLLDNDEWPK